MEMGGKARIFMALAVIASLFVAACQPGPEDQANARGFNDPDALGDPEDDGLDTRTNARTDTSGDTATGDGTAEGAGTTSSQYTGSEGTGGTSGTTGSMDTRSEARGEVTADSYAKGDSNIYTDDTRANARDSDVTVNVYDDDTTLGDDGLETYSPGATDGVSTRSEARDSADTDMVVETYVTEDLNLGDEWVLVRTMTLDTEPEMTTIYVYANTGVDTTSNARMTTTTRSTSVNTYAGTTKDGMDVESDDTMVEDTRSNARATTQETDDGSGTTSIILVESETRSSYRGATVSTVDDEAALLYVIVRGGEVVGAVVADEAESVDVNTVANTRLSARATVDDEDEDDTTTAGAPWNELRGGSDDDEDETTSDDDEDDVSSAGSPWNEYR